MSDQEQKPEDKKPAPKAPAKKAAPKKPEVKEGVRVTDKVVVVNS